MQLSSSQNVKMIGRGDLLNLVRLPFFVHPIYHKYNPIDCDEVEFSDELLMYGGAHLKSSRRE